MMNIQQAVGRHSDVIVWNLSQGINAQIEDNRFSDLAVALDSLKKQYNILICKSAGNIDNPADTSQSFRRFCMSYRTDHKAHDRIRPFVQPE